MNFLTTAISGHWNKHQRLIGWARLLAGYSAVQALAQGLGFLAGIMIVRALPKEDYAYFMIVNTIGPIMNMLSDTGVSNSLNAIGGKHWQDNQRMGSLINTAMILRRQLVVFSCVAVAPVLVWMLWRNHAPVSTITELLVLTLIGVLFQINNGVLGVVIGLRQQIGRMQQLAFAGVLPRLALIAAFAGLGWLNSPLAVASATITLALQFWLLERWVKPQIDAQAPANYEFRRDILAIVKRQAPLTIYFCLQSQVSIWLISIFGNVERVAEVGALGRIGMIFSILITTASALVVPRFARCQEPILLRRRYFQILLAFFSLMLVGTLFSWLFPQPLLWLIGPKYAQLDNLVWLAVLANGTYSFATLIYLLNSNKGWIPPATVSIPLEIVLQLVLCLSLDLSKVRGVLLIAVITPLVLASVNLGLGIQKLSSQNQNRKPNCVS